MLKKSSPRVAAEPFFGLWRSRRAFRTIRENGTDNWLLIHNLSGTGLFRHAAGELCTGRGDAVLLLPGVMHDYGSADDSIPYIRLFAQFQPRAEWHDLLQWPAVAPGIKKLSIQSEPNHQKLVRSFKEAVAFGLDYHPRNERFAMNALEKVLLWCDAENPSAESNRLDTRIGRALDFIAENFSKPISLTALAQHCGLSISRFCWLFHHCTGETPQRYIETRRMNRARQLLRFTQHSIQEVAAETGYSDPFYFSLRFKQYAGLSPRAFRNKNLP